MVPNAIVVQSFSSRSVPATGFSSPQYGAHLRSRVACRRYVQFCAPCSRLVMCLVIAPWLRSCPTQIHRLLWLANLEFCGELSCRSSVTVGFRSGRKAGDTEADKGARSPRTGARISRKAARIPRKVGQSPHRLRIPDNWEDRVAPKVLYSWPRVLCSCQRNNVKDTTQAVFWTDSPSAALSARFRPGCVRPRNVTRCVPCAAHSSVVRPELACILPRDLNQVHFSPSSCFDSSVHAPPCGHIHAPASFAHESTRLAITSMQALMRDARMQALTIRFSSTQLCVLCHIADQLWYALCRWH